MLIFGTFHMHPPLNLVVLITNCLLFLIQDWQWQILSVGLLVSWVNLVLFYKIFPRLGMYVHMFIATAQSFLGVIGVFYVWVVGFALAYYMLLQNQVGASVPHKNYICSIKSYPYSWVLLPDKATSERFLS